MGKLLEVKHLKKYFPTKSGMLHAVDDVSFSIDEGKTLGGCGRVGLWKINLGTGDSSSATADRGNHSL